VGKHDGGRLAAYWRSERATAHRAKLGALNLSRRGVARGPYRKKPIEERFWSKVDKVSSSTGCWIWTSTIDPQGYGRFHIGARGAAKRGAHRVAYELAIGPISDGLTLDHLCRVRRCVNPAHLEAVTLKVNILRGEGAVARQVRRRGRGLASSTTRLPSSDPR